MNTDKCKECNSISLEKCLKIQCPYWMNIKKDDDKSKNVKVESDDTSIEFYDLDGYVGSIRK